MKTGQPGPGREGGGIKERQNNRNKQEMRPLTAAMSKFKLFQQKNFKKSTEKNNYHLL